MRKLFTFISTGCFSCFSVFGAIDLKESKFTQVVNDVQVISTTDNAKHAATVDGLFKMPDVLRTGPASRAELVAGDNTITRVGANTVFSFDAANRTINLQQGSLLFNTPKGQGGGSIHTAAATAAVLGTTIIVTTTTNGGFKVLTLEGTAEVKFLTGLSQRLHAGQLIFVLPGSIPGPVVSFRLDQQVSGSKLVSGFSKTLPSLPKINAQISQQTKQIQSGQAQDTGVLAGNSATSTSMQVINVVAENNASPDPTAGIPGTTTQPPPPPTQTGPFPPGYVPPAGLTLSGSGFLNPDGFVFTTSTTSTAPIEYAAGPAAATVGTPNDVTITDPSLDPTRIFLSGVDIVGINSSLAVVISATGLFARNITINTPTIDLTAYSGMNLSSFDFVASENLIIASSLIVTGFNGSLLFTAGGQLLIEPGVVLNMTAPALNFSSAQGIMVNSAQIMNIGGPIDLSSLGPVSVNNSTIASDNDISVSSGVGAAISGSTINSGGTTTISTGGALSIDSGTITSGNNISVNSQGAATISSSSTHSAGNTTISAVGPLSITSGTLQAFTSAFISSETSVSIMDTSITAPTVNGQSFGTFAFGGEGQITGINGVSLAGDQGLTVGASIFADMSVGSIFLGSDGGAVTLNNGAQVRAANITIEAFTIATASSTTILGSSGVNLESSSDMNLGGNITADPSAGTISLTSESGTVTLNSGAFVNAASINLYGNSITTAGSSVLQGMSSVSLQSAGDMNLSGIIKADPLVGSINLASDFGQVTLNTGAQVAAGTVTLAGNSIDTGASQIMATSSVSLHSSGDTTVGGTITADPMAGSIGLTSDNGQVSVNNDAQLTAATITLAANTIATGPSTIQGATLVNLHSLADVTLGGSINADPMVGTINVLSDTGPLTVNNGAMLNAATITLAANTISSAGTISGTTSVYLHSATGMAVSGTIATGSSGSIGLQNDAGQLTVNSGAQLNAPTVTLQSGNGILVDSIAPVTANTMNILGGLNATDFTTVQNTDLSNLGALNVIAQTIVMANVALPNSGNTVLISQNGLFAPNPNTDAAVVPGDVNFLHNVTYHGALANTPGIGFTIGHP